MDGTQMLKRYGWYAAWAALLAVLIALPIVVLLAKGSPTVTADGMLPPPSLSATPTPTTTPTKQAATDEPLCANVWQRGNTLPAAYTSCQSRGKVVTAATDPSGSCVVTYAKQFFATPGGTVQALGKAGTKAPAYQRAAQSCPGAGSGPSDSPTDSAGPSDSTSPEQ